jgi:heat shock protein HslJ/membrane-bound inhibitor of C-type lysozyme
MQIKPMALLQSTAIAAVVLFIAGCDSEPAQPEQWLYHCGAQTISVTDMGSESIEVRQDGKLYRLVATAAASGSRYVSADQQVEFWSKGHEATLNKQGNVMPVCILDGHLPSQYTAHGNQPSWQLRSSDLTLHEVRNTTPRQWVLHDQQGNAVELTAGHCVDSMSGRYYPYQVDYTRNDQLLKGCGGDSQRLLAGSRWALVGTMNKPVRPQIQFGTELSVSGFTGCNQFRGSYRLTPEAFGFNPLAVTRKACETEIMATEHDFLRQLLEVEQFSFDDQGRLLLHSRGGEPLLWEKTSESQA